ncbi:MAG: RNA 2',3'-cyclic phosphodiesterase [Candidatus Omnitrophica bacterium]|nr:RNA 2',3'-cyclic phosphodiesterase [Candidatus Omnitrophota bacterium]
MRTFIAIELSDEIRKTLSQAQSHLRYSGADVKWVSEENTHLTLKFLGELSEDKVEKVTSILDNIAKNFKTFEISLKDIGAFPKIEFPKVIWVGLDKGAKESAELASRIDISLSEMGFAGETRPFAAHLTIGRVRSPKNKAVLKDKILSYHLQPTTYNIISSVILFKSVLTPHGPVYTKLHESYFLPKS